MGEIGGLGPLAEGLPPAFREAIRQEMARGADLTLAGFAGDDFGQFHARDCRVTMYFCCGEWEIDITLPGGGMGGIDVPPGKVTIHGRKAAAARKEPEGERR